MELGNDLSGVGARMWSPAHLRAIWNGGELSLSWIRRARKGRAPSGAGEPPIEVAEAYCVQVKDDGSVVRQWDVDSTAAAYPAAAISADFPSRGVAVMEVARLGGDGEPGAWARASVTISP